MSVVDSTTGETLDLNDIFKYVAQVVQKCGRVSIIYEVYLWKISKIKAKQKKKKKPRVIRYSYCFLVNQDRSRRVL